MNPDAETRLICRKTHNIGNGGSSTGPTRCGYGPISISKQVFDCFDFTNYTDKMCCRAGICQNSLNSKKRKQSVFQSA